MYYRTKRTLAKVQLQQVSSGKVFTTRHIITTSGYINGSRPNILRIVSTLNHLMRTLKPQRGGPHYAAIWWLVHWQLMSRLLHLVQRGRSGRTAAPPSPLHAVPNPLINGQCTNFVLFDVPL